VTGNGSSSNKNALDGATGVTKSQSQPFLPSAREVAESIQNVREGGREGGKEEGREGGREEGW